MDIDQLTDQPTTIAIGGQDYVFSEFPMESLGRLQKWIRTNVPNPLIAVRPLLPDFNPEQQELLLDQARRDALRWPPKVGTAAGAAALLGSEPGQLETLLVALQVHQPETTAEDAKRLFRTLKREAQADRRRAKKAGGNPESAKATRIFAIAFGMDELLDEDADPKDEGADPDPATPTSPSPST